MSATAISVRVEGPTSGRTYSSLRAASRSLSGNGTDRVRSRIARTVRRGGGFVGNVYVTRA